MTQIPYWTWVDDLAAARDRIEPRLQSSRRVNSLLQVSTWDVDSFAFVLRWGVTLFGVLGGLMNRTDLSVRPRVGVAIGVLLYALVHSCSRVNTSRLPGLRVAVALSDVTVYGAAAYFTGIWTSPYAVCVACSIALSGLTGGVWPFLAGLAEILSYHVVRVGLGAHTLGTGPFTYKSVGIFAVGVLGVCGNRLFKLQKLRATEIDSLRSVNEVHSLLIELHARAADDPRSLTLNGAIQSVVEKVKGEISADVVALLIPDPADYGSDRQWQVVAADGGLLPPVILQDQLPTAARRPENHSATIRWPGPAGHGGLDPSSTSGLCAPLWGHSSLLGMLILERRSSPPFTDAEAGKLDQIAVPAGLAIENTQWFSRLRQFGAEEERDRIARELHDRVGQSLAGVGLAAERLALTLPPEVPDAKQELQSLAEDVRGVTRQIREKLTDLRTTPSATQSLESVLGEFVERVAARSNLQVTFDHRPVLHLSAAEEHEVWRIGQEAILNAERHAGAKCLRVFWGQQSGWRLLVVSDDGKGIVNTAPFRRDAYGLIGMRERAEVMGASLRIDTVPGEGTTVILRLKDARP